MVIQRVTHFLLIASLALLVTGQLTAKEYVYLQERSEGAIPPEPFADDLGIDSNLADDLGFDADTSDDDEPFGDDPDLGDDFDASDDPNDDNESTDSVDDCPPIEKLLGAIKPASSMSASIITNTNRPTDCSAGLFLPARPAVARTANITQFNWQASNFMHRPLYFDDTPLERYGQSLCPPLQPVISGARFFGTFAVLPYKMGIDRTGDCVSTLGYYRPGSCAPCVRERIIPAFEGDAALLEAGTAIALILILP